MNDLTMPLRRQVYCVMSARALPYARYAISSLLANSMEALDLTFVTDEEQDRIDIAAALGSIARPAQHAVSIRTKSDTDQLALEQWSGLPNLARFREGHPCWRKITDPLLLAKPGEEVVVLDPDLYFPNLFRFERTPDTGILLMWQPPSCLLPDEVVMNAYRGHLPLAHHVDIGVAHARKNIDLEWLDGVLGQLAGDKPLPRAMHVEAIVWAAIALKEGGAYLDPALWHCYRNSQWKRAVIKLHMPGSALLLAENFAGMKCFHGGGPAKWWLPAFIEAKRMPAPRELPAQSRFDGFDELTLDEYESSQRLRRMAKRLGYYRLFGSAI